MRRNWSPFEVDVGNELNPLTNKQKSFWGINQRSRNEEVRQSLVVGQNEAKTSNTVVLDDDALHVRTPLKSLDSQLRLAAITPQM
jgi:hypothetical protein